jgi:putative oxidoreductase
MAVGMELGCSTLILTGLLTRPAVVALFGMILTIQVFVYPSAWPDHIQWSGFMLFVLLRGPGAISADRLIARRLPAAVNSRRRADARQPSPGQ